VSVGVGAGQDCYDPLRGGRQLCTWTLLKLSRAWQVRDRKLPPAAADDAVAAAASLPLIRNYLPDETLGVA